MEKQLFSKEKFSVTRIGIGTWAIGGWLWGGTKESDSIEAILAALQQGINLIDTAPVYGFGLSEEIVGKALKIHGDRKEVFVATKCGLSWDSSQRVVRDSRKETIFKEFEASCKRLQTDYIDLYQVHWPDEKTPFQETAEALEELRKAGCIRSTGFSNASLVQMQAYLEGGRLDSIQIPFNLFERNYERVEIPFSLENSIHILGYSSLCRGLLTGSVERKRFSGDDLRQGDPKFQEPQYSEYLSATKALEAFAQKRYGKSLLALAIRWTLDKGIGTALWGIRSPKQIESLSEVFGWNLTKQDLKEIDQILEEHIPNPITEALKGPPMRED